MQSSALRKVAEPMMASFVEPILHPSEWRIRALGLSTALGHPLFYLIWRYVFPQPYERLWQRAALGMLGLVLLLAPQLRSPDPSRGAGIVFTAVFWISLPVFFTWMYLCNGANTVWLASTAAMVLIYYQITDWRLATVGLATGAPVAWLLFASAGPPVTLPAQVWLPHLPVLGFAWYMGLVLSIRFSNLRREQLKQTLATMGILAHELRTPLATMALIGDAVQNQAQATPGLAGENLALLASRLHGLVRNMNRQIDLQITNAQLMALPPQREVVSAAAVARQAVANFPYRNERERDCVTVRVLQDFEFRGSAQLFTHVIDNLVKNAFRALSATATARRPGDLTLIIDSDGAQGQITVTDRGAGMSEATRARLFRPFVSSSQGSGHGLGLAFCLRVVREAHGTMEVESAPGQGACFTIRVPALSSFPVTHASLERSIP